MGSEYQTQVPLLTRQPTEASSQASSEMCCISFPLRRSFAMSNGDMEPSHHCRVGMAEPLASRSWLFLLPMLTHPLPQSIIHPQLFPLSVSAVEIAHLLLPVPCAESSQLLPQRVFFIQCTQLARGFALQYTLSQCLSCLCLLDSPRPLP